MHKSQCRNTGKMKKQDNVTPPKAHNSVAESKDMKELKCQRTQVYFKCNRCPQRRFKQMNEVGKSIQDQDNKVSNVDEKFSKEIEILKRKKNEQKF
jgi:hypothetical protein